LNDVTRILSAIFFAVKIDQAEERAKRMEAMLKAQQSPTRPDLLAAQNHQILQGGFSTGIRAPLSQNAPWTFPKPVKILVIMRSDSRHRRKIEALYHPEVGRFTIDNPASAAPFRFSKEQFWDLYELASGKPSPEMLPNIPPVTRKI
jgi:hypothetical protein